MSEGRLCERFPQNSERPDGSSRPAFRFLGPHACHSSALPDRIPLAVNLSDFVSTGVTNL